MDDQRLSLDYKIQQVLMQLIGFAKTSGCTTNELEIMVKSKTEIIIKLVESEQK